MNMVCYKVTFQDDSPYLQHYGVLGMKWGHRKDGMPQGTIGSGSARGRARVNGVLSDRQKKIAKGIAIGAGVAALGIGAHMTGADRAVINAVRGAAKGYGHRYGVKGLARSTRNQVNISRKLGKAGMKGVGSSSKAIGSQVKANAAKMKRSNPLSRQGDYLKAISGGLKSQREGARKIAASKSGAGKAAVNRVLHTPPPIPASAKPKSSMFTTSPSGKTVRKVPAEVYRRRRAIDAKKAAEAARAQAIRTDMSKNPLGRAYLRGVSKVKTGVSGPKTVTTRTITPNGTTTTVSRPNIHHEVESLESIYAKGARANASMARHGARSTQDTAAAYLAATGQGTKKRRRWL